jgi:hypothetical protein
MKRVLLIPLVLVPLLAAGDCQPKPEPRPTDKSVCGTGPDGLIYCEVPPSGQGGR